VHPLHGVRKELPERGAVTAGNFSCCLFFRLFLPGGALPV